VRAPPHALRDCSRFNVCREVLFSRGAAGRIVRLGASLAPAAHLGKPDGQREFLSLIPAAAASQAVSTLSLAAGAENQVMRYIPTSQSSFENFKKEAKHLQREKGGKHVDALERVARRHGYDHWHHVVRCRQQTEIDELGHPLIAACEAIVRDEIGGRGKLIMTGPEASASQPFVLFSTTVGDAWLLDPLLGTAASLIWQGKRRGNPVSVASEMLHILWDSDYELVGNFFRVTSSVPEIGTRAIAGYPLEALRAAIDEVQSIDQRIAAVIDQSDAIKITNDVVANLVRAGWDEARVRDAAGQGGRYSPSRNSILFPPQEGSF
jgi:hypothetical protein